MQYIAPPRLFQLDFGGSRLPDFPRNSLIRLALRGNEPGFTGGFQLEGVVRQLLVDLNLGILGQTVIAARLEELLLDRNAPGGVDPEQLAPEVAAGPEPGRGRPRSWRLVAGPASRSSAASKAWRTNW